MAMMPVCIGSCTPLRSTTPGRAELDGAVALRGNGSLAVERLAERVDDAAEQRRPRGDLHDAAGGAHCVVLADDRGLAHEHGAHLVLVEVEGQSVDGVSAGSDELEEFARHGALQAVAASDTVTDLHDGADLTDVDLRLERLELLLEHLVDRACTDLGHLCLTSLRCVRERGAHRVELRGEAPVEHAPGDVDADTTENRPVHALAQRDRAAESCGELLGE